LTAAAPATTAGLVTPRQLADASQRTTVTCAAGVVPMDVVERRNSSGSTGSNSTCSANASVHTAGSGGGSGGATSSVMPARNDAKVTSSATTFMSSLGAAPAIVPLPAPVAIRGKTVLYQLETFPLKLQRILDKFESEGRTDVLSKHDLGLCRSASFNDNTLTIFPSISFRD
jgi:hypothetical protein